MLLPALPVMWAPYVRFAALTLSAVVAVVTADAAVPVPIVIFSTLVILDESVSVLAVADVNRISSAVPLPPLIVSVDV